MEKTFAVCKMGGHDIEAKDTLKILGIILDSKLTWEENNAEKAGKASGVAKSIQRSAKILRIGELKSLVKVVATWSIVGQPWRASVQML